MPFSDEGDRMFARADQMHSQMNQMANQMFKGFGGGMMSMGDPFKDDPFFNGKGGSGMSMLGGFDGMDRMMGDMRKEMSMPMGKGGQGSYQMQSYGNTTKIGPDGRPVKEVYQTKTQGARGADGKHISERHQMYDNSKTGHQKMAHERMLDGQGRKVVK